MLTMLKYTEDANLEHGLEINCSLTLQQIYQEMLFCIQSKCFYRC